MDQNTMLAMGLIKVTHPQTKETKMLEIRGFDVLGFFFPFLRLAFAGMWGKFALFCCTFYVYPVWAWYMGFKFNRMNLEQHIKDGWIVDSPAKAA
ncbi:MAG: hypothetical protein EOP09_20340 [Proteobacteria bacterium]|nr:MAG: hypothetical protein EOP09_20340 [Pseudomonadota bacterium]